MLRKFHQALTNVEESPKLTGVYRDFNLDDKIITEQLRRIEHIRSEQEFSTINHFYSLLTQHSVNMSNLPQTIIHGDWHPTNLLYTSKGEIQCVLDFDSLQTGMRIFDVAYALYYFLIFHNNKSMSEEFLKGYGSLTPQEITILPIFVAKIGFLLGLFARHEAFQFTKFKSQLEWSLSQQGIRMIRALCVREK